MEKTDVGSDADALLAGRIAAAAAARLLELRRRGGVSIEELKALGDAASQSVLAEALAAERPGDVVLSEEGADDARRVGADRVWIIDPLDGTREYSEGRADWAVHVALWTRGRALLGAVALPAEGILLSSYVPPTLGERAPGPLRLAVSRTRPPQIALDVAERLGFELVAMGSAGYKIAAVIRGQADAYVHAGGQYQWDSAAPVAVALAAGVHASRLDGSPLRYNEADVYLPDLVVARSEIASRLLDALASDHGSTPEAPQ